MSVDNRKLLNSLYDESPDLEDEVPTHTAEVVTDDADPEYDPYEDVDPVEQHTSTKRSQDPLKRVAFWGGTLGLTGVALFVLASNFDLSKMAKQRARPQSAKAEAVSSDEAPTIKEDKRIAALAFADQDVAQERAESVMKAKEMEAEMLRQNQGQVRDATTKAVQPRPVSSKNTVTMPRRTPTALSPTYRPKNKPTAYRVPTRPRIVAPTSTPAPRPRPVKPIAPSVSKSVATPPAPVQEIDPAALYASIDNVGTYGGMDYGQQPTEGNAFQSGFDQSLGKALMSPGDTLAAQLETPIFWSSNRAQTTALAVITQGNSSIPTGTKISVSMGEAKGDNSKLVALQISNIVLDGQARSVNGQTSITNHKGKPLEAKKKGSGSKILPVIAKTLLGAASKGTGLINRPNNITTTSTGFSSTVSQSGDNDILAGLVQGGTDALLGDLNQRNEAALQTNQGQEFFILKAGTQIQITAIDQVKG